MGSLQGEIHRATRIFNARAAEDANDANVFYIFLHPLHRQRHFCWLAGGLPYQEVGKLLINLDGLITREKC